jgi:flagellar motility protein MotE (MotC chaperone)
MARKKKTGDTEKKGGNKVLTILIALLVVIIWLAFFILFIKLDIGGFGSGVLRPILKDVPVIKWILPDVSDEQIANENDYEYSSLPQTVAKIKELELTIQNMKTKEVDDGKKAEELQAEIKRLKVFEKNQKAFEEEKAEFDKNVVFAENAPDIENYKTYYEQIEPENAKNIYRQVVEQLEYDKSITEKADIYKNMKPPAAAAILETMSADIDSVAKILLSMKPKESAKIMAEMDSVFAAKITKKMLEMNEKVLAN